MEALQARDGLNAFVTSGGGKAEDDGFTIVAADMQSRSAAKQKGKIRYGPPASPFAASHLLPASTDAGRRQSYQKAPENAIAGPSRRPGSSAISGSRQALLSTQATKDRKGGNIKSDGHHSDKHHTLTIKDRPSGRLGPTKSPENPVSGHAGRIFRNPYTNPEARQDSKSRSKSPEKNWHRHIQSDRNHDALEPLPPASTARNRNISPYTRPSPSKVTNAKPSSSSEEEEPIESFDNEVQVLAGPPSETRAQVEAATRRAPSRLGAVSPTKHSTGPSPRIRRRLDSHSPDHVIPHSPPRPPTEARAGATRKTVIPSSNLDIKTKITGAWAEHEDWGTLYRFVHVSALHVRDGMLVIASDTESSMTGILIYFEEIKQAKSCRTRFCPSITLTIEMGNPLERESLSRLISDGITKDPVRQVDLLHFKMHLRLPANPHTASLLDALYNRMKKTGNIHVGNLLQEQCDHGQKTYDGVKKYRGRQYLHGPPQTRQRNSPAPNYDQAGSASLRTAPMDHRPNNATARPAQTETKGKGKAKVDTNQSTLQFGPSKLTNGSTAGGSEGLRRSARKSNAPVVENMDDVQDVQAGPSRSPAIPAPADREAVLFPFPFSGRSLLNITKGDKWRVETGQYLNDTLVEWGLLHMLSEREGDPQDVHLFNSFFYQKIGSKEKRRVKPGLPWAAYDTVRKWTKTTDIFAKRFIIVPINEDLHWYLAVIYNPGAMLREAITTVHSSPEAATTALKAAKTHSAISATEMAEGGESSEEAEVDRELFDKEDRAAESDDPIDSIDRPGHRPIVRQMGHLSLEGKAARSPERVISDEEDMSKSATIPTKPGAPIDEFTLSGLRGEAPDTNRATPARKASRAEAEPDHQILNNEKCWIFTFDSLGSSHVAVANTLNRWLAAEAKDKKGIDIGSTRAEYIHAQVPLQDNDSDCGLFLVHYATKLIAKPEEVLRFIERRPPKPSSEERAAYQQAVDGIWATKNNVLRDVWRAKIESLEMQFRQMQKDEIGQKSASTSLSQSPEKKTTDLALQSGHPKEKVDDNAEQTAERPDQSTETEHAIAPVPKGAPMDGASRDVDLSTDTAKASAPATGHDDKIEAVEPTSVASLASDAAETRRRALPSADHFDKDRSMLSGVGADGLDTSTSTENEPDNDDLLEAGCLIRQSNAHEMASDEQVFATSGGADSASSDDEELIPNEPEQLPETEHLVAGDTGAEATFITAEDFEPEATSARDQRGSVHSGSSQAQSSFGPTPAGLALQRLELPTSTASTPRRLITASGPKQSYLKDDAPNAPPPSSPLTATSDHANAFDTPTGSNGASGSRPSPFQLHPRPRRLSSSYNAESSTPSRSEADRDSTSGPRPSGWKSTSMARRATPPTTARKAPPPYPPSKPPWLKGKADKLDVASSPNARSGVDPKHSTESDADVNDNDAMSMDGIESVGPSSLGNSEKENVAPGVDQQENRAPQPEPAVHHLRQSSQSSSAPRRPSGPARSVYEVSDDEPEAVQTHRVWLSGGDSKQGAERPASRETRMSERFFGHSNSTVAAPDDRDSRARARDDELTAPRTSRASHDEGSTSSRSPLSSRPPSSPGRALKKQDATGRQSVLTHDTLKGHSSSALSVRRPIGKKTYAKKRSHQPTEPNPKRPLPSSSSESVEPSKKRRGSLGKNRDTAIDIDASDSD